MTANNEFIDTNILVYAYNASLPEKQVKAQSLLTTLWSSNNGCLSIQVFQEFYTVVTRKIPHPLSTEVAATIIRDYGTWDYHSPEFNDLLQAIEIQQKYKLSFWDSLIICSAVQLRCKLIWSEDLNHSQIYEGVTAINPFLS